MRDGIFGQAIIYREDRTCNVDHFKHVFVQGEPAARILSGYGTPTPPFRSSTPPVSSRFQPGIVMPTTVRERQGRSLPPMEKENMHQNCQHAGADKKVATGLSGSTKLEVGELNIGSERFDPITF